MAKTDYFMEELRDAVKQGCPVCVHPNPEFVLDRTLPVQYHVTQGTTGEPYRLHFAKQSWSPDKSGIPVNTRVTCVCGFVIWDEDDGWWTER